MYRITAKHIFNPRSYLVLIRIIKNKIKMSVIRLRYRIFNKNIVISKKATFNQRTILSGKGSIKIGGGGRVSVGYKLGGYYHNHVTEFQARYVSSRIIINEDVAFNNSNCIIAGNLIQIGSGCRIGANVLMMDYEAHGTDPSKRDELGEFGEIIIGRKVWIGSNVIILKNVYIGDNCIVAAGSVVIKGNYPENSIIGGNPAKVIKQIE